MKITRKELFSGPNILCYIRILLIPLFVLRYLTAENTEDYVQASAVLLLSGLTDYFNGFANRKNPALSDWAKIIDPVADKLMQIAVAVSLMLRVKGVMIYLLAFLVLKDLFIGFSGLYFLRRGKKLQSPKWSGKLATVVFYMVTFLIVTFPWMSSGLQTALLSVAWAFLLLSFVLRVLEFVRMLREPQKDVSS